MKSSAIIRLVSSAFRDVPKPECTLADSAVADERGDERARFEENDRTWEDIPDAQIARNTAAFCFLPMSSWKYYIPAYMVWTIRHVRDYKTETPTHLLYSLTKNNVAPAFRDSLNSEQRQAVLAFLDFWRNAYPDWTTEDDCSLWRSNEG